MDLRVAGQHLLDQRRARARQAEDEDRPRASRARRRRAARRSRGRRRRSRPVDEPLVLGRVVVASCAVASSRVRALACAQALGGAGVTRRGRRARGPGRTRAGPRGAWRQLAGRPAAVPGPPDRRRAACRAAASPAGRAAARRLGCDAQRRAERRLGLGQLAQLLVQPAQVQMRRAQTRAAAGCAVR